MISLLAVNHQFQLGELFGHRQHLLLVDLFVASEEGTTWLLFLCIERILSETA